MLVLFHGHEPELGARAVREAHARGERWAAADTSAYLPTVALLWPAEHVRGLLAWAERVRPQEGYVADDWIVARYCREHDVRPLIAVPNLVEHPDRVASVAQLDYSGPARTSCCPPLQTDASRRY